MEPICVTADATSFTCNAYLVPGDRPTLVDAGTMPGVGAVIADHVDALDTVVITHQHRDHVGELDAVLDRFDARLLAAADHPRRDDSLADGDEVRIGDELCTVVETPGHAPDHVSLVGDTRIYTGDVVVYNDGAFGDGSFGRTDAPGQSRDRLVASLQRLLERLPDTAEAMYPGHGDIYRAADGPDSVRDVIERALARAERHEPKYPEE